MLQFTLDNKQEKQQASFAVQMSSNKMQIQEHV